ncbi:MAG: YeeE/YedE family protein [Sediminibacterium sp.]
MIEWMDTPWKWYVAGPLIGLTVPLLLWLDNKRLGISANLRHLCAIVIPTKLSFFQYDWRKESWNLFLAAGIVAGGWFATHMLNNGAQLQVAPSLTSYLESKNLVNIQQSVPVQLFSWTSLGSFRGFIGMVVGGWLVGFGTRYAGGCTSGHAISGISQLQWPSLLATCCFMLGGILATYLILPYLL